MFRIILLILIVTATDVSGGAYYIAPHGNDLNPGDKWFRPFRTIQKAADLARAGDTVYVMNGDYYSQNESLINIERSGTDKAWIVFKNYLNHKPVLHLKNSYGIRIKSASYISIEGFTFTPQNSKENNQAPKVSSTGIFLDGSYPVPCSHIKIYNNFFKNLPGNGILANYFDYVIISYNKLYNNANVPDVKGSIVLLNSLDTDSKPVIHNFIQANVLEKNSSESMNCQASIHIEGNPNLLHKNYLTLIHNNIIYSNGGGGIRILASGGIRFIHNTLYKNSELPLCNNAEIELSNSSLIQILNNIFNSSDNKPGSIVKNSSQVRLEHNLYYNFSSREKGKNDLVFNPEFELINDEEKIYNFRLKGNSRAINAGLDEFLSDFDYEGNSRKMDTHTDIGALEFTNRVMPSLKNFKEGVASTGTSGIWSSLFSGDQKIYTLWNHKKMGFSIRIFDQFGNLVHEQIRSDNDENTFEFDYNQKATGYYTVFAYNSSSRFIERIQVKSKSANP